MRLQPRFQNRHAIVVMAIFFFLAQTLFLPHRAYGENSDVQNLLDRSDPSGNIEQLLEGLDALKTNRIVLNDADADALRQLPWLTPADIHALLSWRREHGALRSMSDLDTILGKEKRATIAPYIVLQKEPLSGALKPIEQFDGTFYTRLFWETTERKGIINGAYGGGNYKLYNRLQFSVPHVQASMVQEKDIGEPDVADFTTLTVSLHDLGFLKNAVLGNYQLNLAQGLLIGQSRYFSKGSEPTASVRLSSKQLTPYTSSAEYGFLQGVAATMAFDPFEVTAFHSANHLDGVLSKEGVITSFTTSGYHRTALEISRKDNVTERVWGANLLYHLHSGLFSAKAGGTVLHYSYSDPYDALQPDALQSSISAANLYSLESDLSLGKVNVFSETAFSEAPRDASWITGLEYEVTKGVSTVAAHRRYGEHYFSPFAGAFAERGDGAANEEGNYFGVNAKLSERFTVGAYYDLFTFPRLGANTPYASDGRDYRLFITWKESPLLLWNLQVQHKLKEGESNQGTTKVDFWTPLPQKTDRCRLDCDVTLSRHLRLRSRGEVKRVEKEYLAGREDFYGRLFSQQAGYDAGKFGLKGRFTIFKTEDYDAALYAYEDGLPLTSTLGMYNGQGRSLFFVASWQAMPQMKLSGRYEVTWYSDRTVYSSGNDERATRAPASFYLGCYYAF